MIVAKRRINRGALAIVILAACGFGMLVISPPNDLVRDQISLPFEGAPKKSSLIPLAPFIIDDNGGGTYTWAELRSTNASWIHGAGTLTDPYIIEGISIDVNQITRHAIVVNNSRVHFVIRNSMITDVLGDTVGDGGIILSNTTNGRVTGCHFSSCGYAAIFVTRGCEEILLDANNITGCFIGIYAYDDVQVVTIMGNVFSNIGMGGGVILQLECSSCVVTGNNFTNSLASGIVISQAADYNNVSNNYLYNVSQGINIGGSGYNIACNNVIRSSTFSGISVSNSRHVNITGNDIRDGTYHIHMVSAFDCVISGNVLHNATVSIDSDSSGRNVIELNTISKVVSQGILIDFNGFRNIIKNNTVTGAGEGIAILRNCHVNTVSGNTLSNITGYGIRVYDNCDSNTVEKNYIEDCFIGVGVSTQCDATKISSNVIRRCDAGIEVVLVCPLGTLENNRVTTTRFGIVMTSSYFRITGNLVENATQEGLQIGGGYGIVYGNFFLNNTIHATDSGANNIWIGPNNEGGNYWDDYPGTDADGDGTGDAIYNVEGSSNSNDTRPIWDTRAPTFATVPHPLAFVSGNPANLISWTINDTSISLPMYTISINNVVVSNGTWISGVSITLNVDHLAPGNYTMCLTVTDGWGARFGLVNQTGLGGTISFQSSISISTPQESEPEIAITELVIGLLIGAGSMGLVFFLSMRKTRLKNKSNPVR